MGVIRFDGADWVRFSTLVAALGNVSNSAYTIAVLLKRASDPAGTYFAHSYLCAAGPVTKAGFSLKDNDAIYCDLSSPPGDGPTITGTTETYIAVVGKPAGSNPVHYSRYVKSTDTWTHSTPAGSIGDLGASTLLEIGTWQGGSDMADSWIGLVGVWSGDMSDANRAQLSTTWRTSDWYASSHGAPVALIECNVNAASLIDLMGNATNLSVTGTPTLDGAETLVSWNFNGNGSGGGTDGAPTVMADFTRSLFPFMAVSSYKLGSDQGGISNSTRERGPAPYGGFERYLFRRLHPEIVAGVSSETPPPGGAVAGGVGPVAIVATPAGGALAAGTAATVATSVAQGGATAGGVGATAQTVATVGGALAGGFAPVTRTTLTISGATAGGAAPAATVVQTIGGALAAGLSPTPAVVTFAPGGALAGGVAPADGVSSSETPPPGGALAKGVTPTVAVATSTGGATAGGQAITTRTAATAGGALAAGRSPVPATTTPVGGATATGRTPSTVRVTFSPGGATAGGQITDPGQVFVTSFFGTHTPAAATFAGEPGANAFDTGTPAGATLGDGEPSANTFGAPSPRRS